MHSIIRWAYQEELPHKLYLFYSNRRLEDAAFLASFQQLASRNPRFTFVPTLTNSAEPGRMNEAASIQPCWRDIWTICEIPSTT